MKYLLVLLIIVVAAWLLLGRRGGRADVGKSAAQTKGKSPEAQTMLACAHCGLHLPEGDAQRDGSGRPFCSEAHRLAGPR